MERFTFIEKRGEGTFAEVWEVEDKHSGKRAALKILKKRFSSVLEVFQDAEFRTLKAFSSKPSNTKPTKTSLNAGKLVGSSSSGPGGGLPCSATKQRHIGTGLVDSAASSILIEQDKSNLFHPHLTGLHDAFFEPREGKVVFVLELLGKSLLDEIMDRKAARAKVAAEIQRPPPHHRTRQALFNEGELRVILFQILSGVYDMHSRNIFHRDIKPENILFQIPSELTKTTKTTALGTTEAGSDGGSSLKLKLADFGSCQFNTTAIKSGGSGSIGSATSTEASARILGTATNTSSGASSTIRDSPVDPFHSSSAFIAYTEYIATRWYRSPECLLTSGHYGPPMDLWAVGCVAVELLTGHPFFPGENEMHQLQLIHAMFGYPTRNDVERYIGPVGVHLSVSQSFALASPPPPVVRRGRIEKLEGGNSINGGYSQVRPSAGDGSLSPSSSSVMSIRRRNGGETVKVKEKSSLVDRSPLSSSEADKTPSSSLHNTRQPTTQPPSFPSVSHWRSRIVPKILGGCISDSLADLLHRLLAYYPNERITAKTALQHAFFSDVYGSKSSCD